MADKVRNNNKLVDMALKERKKCHIRDIIKLVPDEKQYKWGVLRTLNKIIYYGEFGTTGDISFGAKPCYMLESNGNSTESVTAITDGEYIYPDVWITRGDENGNRELA